LVNGTPNAEMGKALLLIVRRGALSRFQSLQEKAANLRVVLAWDRRSGERRKSAGCGGDDRRVHDRRKQPPFTWETADFLVAGETTTSDD
jgi:hypothetical protein